MPWLTGAGVVLAPDVQQQQRRVEQFLQDQRRRRSRPKRPAAEWKVSIALLMTLMCATGSLNVILDDIGWWFTVLVTSGAVLGSAAVSRLWVRIRVLPTVISALVLFFCLTLQFAAQTTLFAIIPTPSTFSSFGALIQWGQHSITQQTVPAEADPGILFLLAAGIGSLALVADLVAITLGKRAHVGVLVLVVLCIPAFTFMRDFDLFWVLLTVFSFLYLLRADSPVPDRRLTLAIAGGAVALALLAQPVLPSTRPAAVGTQSTKITTGDSPIINLGDNLRRKVDRQALTYTTDSNHAQYLRLLSLDQFDGDTWFASELPFDEANTPDEFPEPPGLSLGVQRAAELTSVRIANLDTLWLPLPYPAQSVDGLSAGWRWDSTLALKTKNGSSYDQSYQVTSLLLAPTPEQLLAAGSVVPPEVADQAVIAQEQTPSIISETARAAAGDEASSYEKAVALQQYLRAGDFVYSEEAPVEEDYDGTGLDVIATFLEVKSGYCVHFASAMALMARSLGIPARVAVGFLPGEMIDGEREGKRTFEASSHDLHSWPELYFEGIGWVPFEPTASRGVVPSYADTTVPGVPLPVSVNRDRTPTPSAAPRPTETDPTGTGADSEADASSGEIPASLLWLIGVGLLVLLLAATPAVVRWGERRMRLRTIRRGLAPAVVGWRELVQSAHDVGVLIAPSETPRATGRILGEMIQHGRKHSKNSNATIALGTDAIDRLVAAVEWEEFARPASGPTSGEGVGALDAAVSDAVASDVAVAVRHLFRAVGWRTRLLALLFPPSLWRRTLRALRRQESN